MQLNFRKRLIKSHHVSKWPLICSNFTHGCSHKDRSQFVDNQYFSHIKRVSPQDTKLLRPPFPIKFSEVFSITDCHNIKNAVISGTYGFGLLFPYLKHLSPLRVHDHAGTIEILAENIHVTINKAHLLNVVS